MALVEMKKVALLALNQDRAQLMKKMQSLGCVQFVEGEGKPAPDVAARLDEIQKRVARLDNCILRLNAFDTHKRGMLDGRPVLTAAQLAAVAKDEARVMAAVERAEAIERERGELRAREARDKALIEQLEPWRALDAPIDKVADSKNARVCLACAPLRSWEAFMVKLSDVPAAAAQEVSREKDMVYALVAAHRDSAPALEAAMKDCDVAKVQFAARGLPSREIDGLREKLKEIDKTRLQLDQEIRDLAQNLPDIRVLRDLDAMERDRLESASRCVETKSAFYMTGWAPENRLEALKAACKKVSPSCEIDEIEPGEGEKAPTLLHNNKLVAPFESIVKMFATPASDGYDPTWIMMPFWVCFFGMMVSDAGYGVVMGIAATFLWWKLKGKGLGGMAWIIAIGSLSTVIWGAIYGGWFGISVEARLLDPMNDAITVLLVCVSAGAVHLLTGLAIAAYMNVKRGKPLAALYDQGFWVLLLAGLGLLLVNGTVGGALAIIGALGIILTAGRDKKGFSRIIGGLGALYGVTSYLSDLLSYARLFGMGLATGVIGMVINMLAGLVMGSPIGVPFGILILLGGHALNLGINALGAYVHSCRLQYIEFFNKFYEAGGRDFRPLGNNTRYVEIADGE